MSEAEALNQLAALPIARDSFLTVTRHASPASSYAAVWQSKAALTRIVERRQRDLLVTKDDEARRLGLDLRTARQRLARLALVPLADPGKHAERLAN